MHSLERFSVSLQASYVFESKMALEQNALAGQNTPKDSVGCS